MKYLSSFPFNYPLRGVPLYSINKKNESGPGFFELFLKKKC